MCDHSRKIYNFLLLATKSSRSSDTNLTCQLSYRGYRGSLVGLEWFHCWYIKPSPNTVEPPNNGHVGDEHFVHCSEVAPYSEVEMDGQYIGRGRTVCPL